MALKQLLLNKKIQERSSVITQLRAEEDKLKEQETELTKALDEAETDEDINVVEESANELEKKLAENKEKIEKLEAEKADLEKELAEIEDKTDKTEKADEESDEKGEQRNMTDKAMTIRESLKIQEVRDFYAGINSAMKEKRSLTGSEKVIPEVVLDRIESKLGDYSVLINEVTVETLNGPGRAIIAGDIPEAIWTEMTGSLKELEDKLDGVEVDGFSLGGFVPVPNSIIEDALINLASYVEDRIAKAIAKALDKAILKGEGATKKQPVGVVTSAVDANKVTSDGKITDLITNLALVDTDGTGGEVIAVMNRKTYYSKIVPQTLAVANNGVLEGSYALPFRVVLSAYADNNQVVLGDFKQFLLTQRAAIRIESSTDVKFVEDQTVFKGVGRYDGKAMKPEAFAVVTITDAPAEG